MKRKSNFFFGKLISVLFQRVDFDNETQTVLKEYSGKGKIVYASFQSFTTSMLILNNLLRRHGHPSVTLALGMYPYLFQIGADYVVSVFRKTVSLFKKNKNMYIPDEAFIKEQMDGNESISLCHFSERLFISRYLRRESDALQYLIEIQKEMETPIFIFPQIMFWNRNPERTDNKALVTSKATGDRGMFSGLFTLFKSATPPFMRIASPINLKEEIINSEHEDSGKIAGELREKLMSCYDHEKRTILGPVIKGRQEMMELVLSHHNTLDTIQELSRQTGVSENKLRRKAYRHFKEIAADFSIVLIQHFETILKVIFRKIFSGIEYDLEEIRKIREAARRGPVILMPTHKSHMDYLILSSIFYREKLIPPHILAGANLSFFPMGYIFRKSGAIFMRRTFKGETLYTSVFKQYLKMLIDEGYSIEFFIEGGRTRNGKILQPKSGIMKYLIEAIKDGYGKDLVFVPAAISYNRVLEENSYSRELKGKEKKKESTSQFVKSRKLLKRNYGKVYLSFNDPVSYQEIKNQIGETAEEVTDIALHLTRMIGKAVIVTPVSIVSCAILSSAGRGFSRELLVKNIMLLYKYLAASGAKLALELKNPDNLINTIDTVLADFETDGIISRIGKEFYMDNSDNGETLYVLNEEDRPKLNFYKNTIVHHLLPIAVISLSIMSAAEESDTSRENIRKNYGEFMDVFGQEFSNLDDIRNFDGFYDSVTEFLITEEIITGNEGALSAIQENLPMLRDCAAILHDYVESYYSLMAGILNLKTGMNKKDLLSMVRKNAIKLYHLEEVKCAESLSMPNYTNAVQMLTARGLLTETTGRKDQFMSITSMPGIMKLKERLTAYMFILNRPLLRTPNSRGIKENGPLVLEPVDSQLS